MSKKSLATFVGNCNQPPKENNLYKQFKHLLELHFYSGWHLVVVFIYFVFSRSVSKWHFNNKMAGWKIVLTYYLWEKIVLVIEKNFWNSQLKAKNLQKLWDHWNNLFKHWKVRANLVAEWRFLRSNKLGQLEFKLEKIILGFRIMEEKLEKVLTPILKLDFGFQNSSHTQ